MRIKKLQEGNIIAKQDNTRVSKPIIPEIIKAKPRQDQLIDLGGEPSTDTRTAAERNRDYWHPIKGAKERFKSSMRNGTNPLVGLERTVMPAMAGAALVTTPATVVGGLLGSEAVNNATGGFGQWLEGKVGIPAEVGEYLNPGAVYGGGKGLNIAMATANRAMPFLSNVEKTPARIAAYKVGRRTKGNASVSLKDIKNNESTYTGSATPEGNNGDRGLLGMYLFQNDPLISKSPWFQKVAKSFKPAKGKEFSHGDRYNQLYPGIENPYIRRQPMMQGALLTMKKGGSLVSDGRRFKFKDSALVKNSKALNNKRDMRKKFMKSDRPTYSINRVRKGQEGLRFTRYDVIERPTLNMDNTFEEYRFPVDNTPTYTIKREETPVDVQQPIIKEEETPIMKRELFNIKPSKGLDEFNKWYDEVEQEDPEAKNYRQFLTKMAEQESGFNSAIQNRAGAPAYGYFQFMQDGKKYNNISAYAGTDVDTFRNNPKLQIKAAIKLAKQFERGFNKQDLELAAQKGYTKFGLLGGAWLAGNGGVRKYLQGLANPSDKHWSKSGSGTDVASRIQMFNF